MPREVLFMLAILNLNTLKPAPAIIKAQALFVPDFSALPN
jgi:hypothetical protein